MRTALMTIALSVCWTGCSIAEPAVTAPQEAAFRLRAGESAPTGVPTLRIGFDGIVADSRCPKGEQCVSAGHAVARVWLQRGPAPREVRELRTAPEAAQRASLLDHELRLVSIEPAPISGRSPSPADAVATLVLSRGQPSASDR